MIKQVNNSATGSNNTSATTKQNSKMTTNNDLTEKVPLSCQQKSELPDFNYGCVKFGQNVFQKFQQVEENINLRHMSKKQYYCLTIICDVEFFHFQEKLYATYNFFNFKDLVKKRDLDSTWGILELFKNLIFSFFPSSHTCFGVLLCLKNVLCNL